MKEEKRKIYHKAKTSKHNPIFKLLNLKWMLLRSAFLVVMFNVLNKVIITMPNRKMKPLKWKLLNSTSCGAVYYAVQSGSNFWIGRWNPEVWPFKWKPLSSTFLWFCLSLYAEQGDSNFWIDQEMNLQAWPFKWKLLWNAGIVKWRDIRNNL